MYLVQSISHTLTSVAEPIVLHPPDGFLVMVPGHERGHELGHGQTFSECL